jgi:hypothetical protein
MPGRQRDDQIAIGRGQRALPVTIRPPLSHDIVVKQHGGKIEVLTDPGSFTEFIITLPRVMP